MKRALLAGLAVTALAAVLPARAFAGNSIPPTTVDPRVPSECWVQFPVTGPSRATHSAPAVIASLDAPGCNEIAGLCVNVVALLGPSRAVHGHPTKPMPEPAPCTPLGEACAYNINYYDYDVPPPGPSRPAHQVPAALRPMGPIEVLTPIPAACQELMVLALVPTGSETRSTVWVASIFLALGAAMILVPRRLARR